MRKILTATILLLFAQQISAQEPYRLPTDPSVMPVDYLRKLDVKDASRQLSNQERHALCRLFIKAYVISIRRYRQDFLLNPGVPVYRLFQANFPGVEKREGEGGIFMGQIVRFINTLSEFRADVNQVLRATPNDKGNCQW
jgi:hypothetical protein